MAKSAIGFIETRGLIGVIEAADVAAKAAHVQLMGFEEIGGGLVSIRFSGDVASVQTAVQAGAEAARRVSEVISHHVIPGPHADLVSLLQDSDAPVQNPRTERPSLEELQAQPVAQLRQLVRQTPSCAHLVIDPSGVNGRHEDAIVLC